MEDINQDIPISNLVQEDGFVDLFQQHNIITTVLADFTLICEFQHKDDRSPMGTMVRYNFLFEQTSTILWHPISGPSPVFGTPW
jgi:hypothetical protein